MRWRETRGDASISGSLILNPSAPSLCVRYFTSMSQSGQSASAAHTDPPGPTMHLFAEESHLQSHLFGKRPCVIPIPVFLVQVQRSDLYLIILSLVVIILCPLVLQGYRADKCKCTLLTKEVELDHLEKKLAIFAALSESFFDSLN